MNSEPIDRIVSMLALSEARGERFESNREPILSPSINALRTEYPDIPEDYLSYLQRVGSGSLISCSYTIYSAPVKAEQIFGAHDPEWPEDLIAFGDNFSGDLGVFEPSSGWAVGELCHEDRLVVRSDKTFTEFMEELISDLN